MTRFFTKTASAITLALGGLLATFTAERAAAHQQTFVLDSGNVVLMYESYLTNDRLGDWITLNAVFISATPSHHDGPNKRALALEICQQYYKQIAADAEPARAPTHFDVIFGNSTLHRADIGLTQRTYRMKLSRWKCDQ